MSEQTAVIHGSGGGVAYIAIVMLVVLLLIGASVFVGGGRVSFTTSIDGSVNGLAQQTAP